mmetsp:Transcript_30126/g.83110  ORF Transcript_30126/g.83110 Transcript_30126/m.83110 type:complete len:333 (+) Transcript_30126:1083-2081(+)
MSISLPMATPRMCSGPSIFISSMFQNHISSSAFWSQDTSVPTSTLAPVLLTHETSVDQAWFRLYAPPQSYFHGRYSRTALTGSPWVFGQNQGSESGQSLRVVSSMQRPLCSMTSSCEKNCSLTHEKCWSCVVVGRSVVMVVLLIVLVVMVAVLVAVCVVSVLVDTVADPVVDVVLASTVTVVVVVLVLLAFELICLVTTATPGRFGLTSGSLSVTVSGRPAGAVVASVVVVAGGAVLPKKSLGWAVVVVGAGVTVEAISRVVAGVTPAMPCMVAARPAIAPEVSSSVVVPIVTEHPQSVKAASAARAQAAPRAACCQVAPAPSGCPSNRRAI